MLIVGLVGIKKECQTCELDGGGRNEEKGYVLQGVGSSVRCLPGCNYNRMVSD